LPRAYYNENNLFAAQWLRNLIAAGVIADGDVDFRSIDDVSPGDVRGYTQCHWFAGAGGWSLALRMAGWPDAEPVWTGSCPCQPWSKAGRRSGAVDHRHKWPAWFRLIRECRPATVLGEQVAGAWVWLDGVFSDMESIGYACAAADLPAACVGAPQDRPRLWFLANAEGVGRRTRLCKTGAQFDRDQPANCSWWVSEPDVARVAYGIPASVDIRRAFGNAIVPQVAAEFIRSCMEATT